EGPCRQGRAHEVEHGAWPITQSYELRRVLARLRRRPVDAAAGGDVPDVRVHGGAVLREPGGEREGHGLAPPDAADRRAHEPSEPGEGQGKVAGGRALEPAGIARDAARGQRAAVRS